MKQIRFVYFDVGDVLVSNIDAHRRIAKHIGKPHKKVVEFFDAHWEIACRGALTEKEYLKLFTDHFQVKTDMQEFSSFYTSFLTPIKETHHLVNEISAHLPVGLLSNAEFGAIDEAIKKSLIPQITWNTKVISAYYKTIKPEEKIFTIAQELANVPHESIFLIDDRQVNIETANKLGWQTHLFNPHEAKNSAAQISKSLGV